LLARLFCLILHSSNFLSDASNLLPDANNLRPYLFLHALVLCSDFLPDVLQDILLHAGETIVKLPVDRLDLSFPYFSGFFFFVLKGSNEEKFRVLQELEQVGVFAQHAHLEEENRRLLLLDHAVKCIAHNSDEHVEDDDIDEESCTDEAHPVDSGILLSSFCEIVEAELPKTLKVLVEHRVCFSASSENLIIVQSFCDV